MEKRVEFTSRMDTRELIAALVYIPVHVFIMPYLLIVLLAPVTGGLSEAGLNVLYYAIGAAYMLVFQWKFLRRDFDAVCDRPLNCLIQICVCYGLMMLFNLAINGLLSLMPLENPNNAAILDMAGMEMGKVAAASVFLAPIVEELMFRAGVFSLIRFKPAAYIVSMAAFSAYHIWGYALSDPETWIYILQYVPASFVLCRCYDRTNSIWGSIFLHMIINGVSLALLSAIA